MTTRTDGLGAAPAALRLLVARGLLGAAGASQLAPWYAVPDGAWLTIGPARYVLFARRADCDLLAAHEVGAGAGVVVCQGWTPEGHVIVERYATIGAWLASVIDELAEELGDGLGPDRQDGPPTQD